jgi:predicted acyltransferase
MAVMVLVNSLGTRVSYPILEHVDWNGCSLADLVFPSFLFIVGITTVISLKRHLHEEGGVHFSLYKTIFIRAILLFLIGLFLNMFPSHFDLTVRVYGILQRIAACYLICAILYLNTSIRTQAFIFLAIIIGYWYFLTQVPIPGSGGYQLSMYNNWVGYVDTKLFSPVHLLGGFEPEGLLGTIPSIATTLVGLLTGSFLLSQTPKKKMVWIMLATGILFLIVAWIWSYNFPINKKLWTSTFVLWSSGFSLIVFSVCFFSIDILGFTKWSVPFKILGMNALLIFIIHVILLKLQSMFFVTMPNGAEDYLRIAIAEYLFGPFSTQNKGLFYSLLFLFLNFLIAVFLYRRKIFFKL